MRSTILHDVAPRIMIVVHFTLSKNQSRSCDKVLRSLYKKTQKNDRNVEEQNYRLD